MTDFLTLRAAAAALLLASAGLGAFAAAGTAAAMTNPAAIGPAVGGRVAMDARLVDSAGKPTTLAAVSAGKPVMMVMVMVRSAKWCPYCQAQLKGLGPVAAAARAKGVRFVAVSYDSPATLAAFGAAQKLSYPLYSDTGSGMIDAMKLRDPQYAAGSFA